MKGNELRIGNWVFYNLVADKNKPAKMFNKIDEEDISQMAKSEKYLKLHEPIPLTPELLEKCGFTKNKYEENVYNHSLDLDLVYAMGFKEKEPHWHYGHDYEHGDGTRPLWKAIDYLHQLQNLFFALTGEELQII